MMLSLVPASIAGSGMAQGPGSGDVVVLGPTISEPVVPHIIDVDLRTLPEVEPWRPGDPVREVPRRSYPRREAGSGLPSDPDTPSGDALLALQERVMQDTVDRSVPAPDLNFEGMPYTGVHPPDTVGEVGPNHYIQMVNSTVGTSVSIYDKGGSLVTGPFALDSLGSGACASGHGDPIVLYDGLADRWLMSEFASIGNHLCVYVSQSPDPIAGGWYWYDFPTPNFPDYPKYAVWPDAYYVSSNESLPAVYALDRQRMLLGQAATYQRFTAPPLGGFPFQALIPSDLDGATPPPAGAPNYFMRHRDDEVHNPGSNDPSQDFVEVWELDVDFITPANSSFTGPLNIPVAEFDSTLCGLSAFLCFPQPGTSTRLDPLREVVMWRLQYRNFGSHETLVGNFVVDTNGANHGGIRWFELRKIGAGAWTLHQEGTFAPDEHHRWLGSIAMDGDGNIAMGYSISSQTVYPGIRYTGRLASDPSGTMPQGEYTVIDGAGSQTGTTRWGDYSSMNVDPSDDCTFWYTNEYMPATGGWRTRIASFRFPTCGGEPDRMYVQFIYLTPFEPQPGLELLLGLVRILDESTAPVAGAAVDMEWTLPNSAVYPQSRSTHANGVAVPFTLGSWPGSYQLCVTDVTAPGYLYDPSMNLETCDSITLP